MIAVRTPLHAYSLLEAAIDENRHGDSDTALGHAAAAEGLFAQVNNKPGELRSSFEHLYALRRESRQRECLSQAKRLRAQLITTAYHWLRAQTAFETASCLGMASQFDAGWQKAIEAGAEAEAADYPRLRSRALAYEAGFDTQQGRLAGSWKTNEEGLSFFWGSTLPNERAFQFYSDLELASEQSGRWLLAVALQRESISWISDTGRLDFEAIAYFRLAAMQEVTGDLAQAKLNILRSQKLFSDLPNTKSTRFYQSQSELALAALEAKGGAADKAAVRLSRLEPELSQNQNFTIGLDYARVQAEIGRISSNRELERSSLQQIISIGDKGILGTTSDQARWDWRAKVEDSHRRLIELDLAQEHDAERALTGWERFAALGTDLSGTRTDVPKFSPASSEPQLLHSFRSDSVGIVFAILDRSVWAWVVDARGVKEFQIQVGPALLRKEATLFRDLCSDPASSLEKVNEVGLRLYQWLLEPLNAEIRTRRIWLIEGDGMLSLVPWAAMRDSKNSYVGDQHVIINVPHLLIPPGGHRPRKKQRSSLVAYPGSVQLRNEPFVALPNAEAEARAVSHILTASLYLEGSRVNKATLLKLLPKVSIFHFAGHAVSRDEGGELIIQGPAGGDFLSSATLSTIRLDNMELVILSACNTGAVGSHNPNGLVWSFFRAGANRILASRWTVESRSTLALMDNFYRGYVRNHDAAESLYSAQLQLRSSPPFAHPYYWSSFTLFAGSY